MRIIGTMCGPGEVSAVEVAGEEASLVVFRWDEEEQALQVCQTLLNGQAAYSAP